MRLILSLLLVSLFFTSCATSSSKNGMSMDTKVKLTSAPELSKPQMAHLLLEIIKNSNIENEEKLKILDGIKIYITELAYVREQKFRSFSAFLNTINDKNDKTFKELNALIIQLSKKELDLQLEFLSYVKKNLKGKGDSELTQSIMDALSNQSQGVQTGEQMNQI
jgi:hypothetical protein